MGKLFI